MKSVSTLETHAPLQHLCRQVHTASDTQSDAESRDDREETDEVAEIETLPPPCSRPEVSGLGT